MNTNTVYRIFVEKLGGTSPSQFVGDEGEIFYDPNVKALKLSNGVTLGGNVIVPQEFSFISTKSDFPESVNGVITLEDNYTYFITDTVDLLGDRLVAGQNTTILGGSSENSRIKSTGIATDVALLSSYYSLPLRNITFEAPYAINLDATDYGSQALDWFGVNFTDCNKVGIISSYNNFIMLDSAFLNSQDLTFDGTMGTVGFNQCLFSGDFSLGGTKSILNFTSNFICTRRIRTTVCSFVVPSGYTGISVEEGVSFSSPESFIIQTCNFSGPGTKLNTSSHTNVDGVDAFFEGNRGIQNSFSVGQYYMRNNDVETTFSETDTFVKIVGITTTTGATNSKFTPSNNRLTCTAGVSREYLIQVSLSVVSSTGGDFSVGIYDSSVDDVLEPSKINFALDSNTPIIVNIKDLHRHTELGDYQEIHIANLVDTNPVTVTDLNVLVTQLG